MEARRPQLDLSLLTPKDLAAASVAAEVGLLTSALPADRPDLNTRLIARIRTGELTGVQIGRIGAELSLAAADG